jgi:hypothetical protein
LTCSNGNSKLPGLLLIQKYSMSRPNKRDMFVL